MVFRGAHRCDLLLSKASMWAFFETDEGGSRTPYENKKDSEQILRFITGKVITGGILHQL